MRGLHILIYEGRKSENGCICGILFVTIDPTRSCIRRTTVSCTRTGAELHQAAILGEERRNDPVRMLISYPAKCKRSGKRVLTGPCRSSLSGRGPSP